MHICFELVEVDAELTFSGLLPRVSILQPCPTKVCVFFVDDVLDILAVLLDLVRKEDTTKARTDCQHLQFPIRRILQLRSDPDPLTPASSLRCTQCSGYRIPRIPELSNPMCRLGAHSYRCVP
jgi:hypothetical protein